MERIVSMDFLDLCFQFFSPWGKKCSAVQYYNFPPHGCCHNKDKELIPNQRDIGVAKEQKRGVTIHIQFN